MILRRNIALFLGISLVAAGQVWAQSRPLRIKPPKKEKEPETQTLPLPPEPPAAVIAETEKLVFHVSPLSAKGLLTQQVHDALKALDRANGGATFMKLRAFVAGTGDMRRVAAIVAEEFSDKKVPLPAVTTVQVGALPDGWRAGGDREYQRGKEDSEPERPGVLFRPACPGACKRYELAATAHRPER